MKIIKYFLLISVIMIISYAIIHGIISYLMYYNNDMNNVIHIGKDNNGYYIMYKVK